MTIRSEINKKKRTSTILFFGGFAIIFLGIIVNNSDLEVITLFGFTVSACGILYTHFGIACPKCKNSWRDIGMYTRFFNISKKIKFCPFCGEDVDKELRSHELQ